MHFTTNPYEVSHKYLQSYRFACIIAHTLEARGLSKYIKSASMESYSVVNSLKNILNGG